MKLLTLARDLTRRKSREKHSLFIAEGVRSVEELLQSGVVVRGAIVAPQLADAPRGKSLRDTLARASFEVAEVSEKDFRTAAATESPQGVIAIGEVPLYSLDTLDVDRGCRLVLLDGVQDPGNVGTIMRTAAALGAQATIALPGTVDLWNPKVIRSSMGAQFRHPSLNASVAEVTKFLAARGISLWAADAKGSPIAQNEPPERLALAFGNEGGGLSSEVRVAADKIISLPISNAVESLNVAVAAGIILYELRA